MSLCCHALVLLAWPASPLRPFADGGASLRDIEVTLSVPRPVIAPAAFRADVARHIEHLERMEHLPAPAAGLPTQPVMLAPAAEAPTTVASAAETPPPAMQVPVEQALEPPRFNAAYLDNPVPAYPLAARRRGIEGKVLVRAEVQDNGHCSQVTLKQSSGYDMLDQAALAAVRNWHFVPARRGETAVVAWVDVPIVFKLQD
ncbi:MAG: TonB family protein [Pseudomonadota bacterium]